jgi:hypothetical protein
MGGLLAFSERWKSRGERVFVFGRDAPRSPPTRMPMASREKGLRSGAFELDFALEREQQIHGQIVGA